VVNFTRMIKPNILQLSITGNFYAQFFQQNLQPMWVFDIFTLDFLEVNNAAIKTYGYTRAEFLAMTIKDIRPYDDIEKLELYVPKLCGQQGSTRPWIHIKKDGTVVSVNVSSIEVLFNGVFARLVTVYDVTN